MLKTVKEGGGENNIALPSQISHHKYEHDLNHYLQANSVTISPHSIVFLSQFWRGRYFSLE